MSKDKRKGWQRRKALVEWALKSEHGTDYFKSPPSLIINHEGGISRNNPDLRRLVADGHFFIPNGKTPPKWSKEFDRFFPLGSTGIRGHAPRLHAFLTEAGRAAYT